MIILILVLIVILFAIHSHKLRRLENKMWGLTEYVYEVSQDLDFCECEEEIGRPRCTDCINYVSDIITPTKVEKKVVAKKTTKKTK